MKKKLENEVKEVCPFAERCDIYYNSSDVCRENYEDCKVYQGFAEMCPFAEECAVEYGGSDVCRDEGNYTTCTIYQEFIKHKEKSK